MAWKRSVEEVLFRKVVLRFRKGVATQRLAEVSVDDNDYAQVDAGMTRCSNYAHDKAVAGGVAGLIQMTCSRTLRHLNRGGPRSRSETSKQLGSATPAPQS
jgi:TPP-dependent pyruvate/acetoin dehydrogenase alpha subunit